MPIFRPQDIITVLSFVANACGLLLYAWLFCLLAPYGNFTFTDPEDFVFATLIPITLISLFVRHKRRPYLEKWTRTAYVLAWIAAVFPPFLLLGMLYAMSWRAWMLLGHWPRWMSDDPKWIGGQDALYQHLLHGFSYAEAFAGWGIISWGALFWHLGHRISFQHRMWLIAAFVVAWLVYACEPGGRFIWLMD